MNIERSKIVDFKILFAKILTYTWMLRDILNISCRQYTTKSEPYRHINDMPTIIPERSMGFVGQYWRAKQELARDVLL